MSARFGPAGNCESFQKQFRSSVQAPAFLAAMGLDAYEYQCGRGVNISEETCRAIGDEARIHGVQMSLHAPYFINLSSDEPERMEKNIGYILASCRTVLALGGERIVVHCGGLSKRTRDEAMANTHENLRRALRAMDEQDCGRAVLCIETMGKVNVLGDLAEVIEICRADERLLPCIDFGHLNARTQGGLREAGAMRMLFAQLENGIGRERTARFHAHFSKIEYSAGGEVRHLTLSDHIYGPEFDEIAEVIARRNWSPTIVCESAGTQAEDAVVLQQIYRNHRENEKEG
ncbi:MAG: endonuclease IV [Clostridium sp. SCN 57-10]|nr:MAG: endonuclease IV [Clostridium sp. SCN 57-10]